MNKSTYDTDNNNKVDDAELVNGLSVETAVPANAVFTDDQDAADVDYDNTNSQLSATSTQGAIDEINQNLANAGDMNKSTYDTDNNNKVDDAELVNGLTVETAVPANAVFTDDQNAADVDYDNTNSQLSATSTQGAIDEINQNLANAGDMNKSTYDTDNDNTVDDAE